jgi:hypothetical protein
VGRRALLRRGGALALGGAAAALVAACGGEEKPKAKVVGWLNNEPPEPSNENFAALLGRLAELGYATGPSGSPSTSSGRGSGPALAWDYAPMRTDQLSAGAQRLGVGVAMGEHFLTRVREMQEAGADAILALENEVPPYGIQIITAATSVRVPVVCLFNNTPDYFPGVVDSHASPGRNITGVTMVTPDEDLWLKRIELLKMAFPSIRRVGFFCEAANPTIPVVRAAAVPLGLEVVVQEIPDQTLLDWTPFFPRWSALALQAVVNGGRGAFADVRVYDFADQQRLPAVGVNRDRTVLYYAASRPALFRRLAEMLDLVLRGTHPSNIPAELPSKFDFVIDLSRVRSAGLTVSPAALALATEVTR